MSTLHNFGLVRFSKRTGKIDTTLTAIGCALLKLWALQNTSKTKACVLFDLDEREAVTEFEGTVEGFPEVRENPGDFIFEFPEELIDFISAQVKRE